MTKRRNDRRKQRERRREDKVRRHRFERRTWRDGREDKKSANLSEHDKWERKWERK